MVNVLNKRERGNTTEHTGLKPPKAQGWWESSTTGAPRRPREQRGALGEGEGPKKFSQPLHRNNATKQPTGCWVSLRLQLRGPRGGIGCKQAPEYCLMGPAKAQLKPGGRWSGGPNSSQGLLRPCLSPVAPEFMSLRQDRPAASKIIHEVQLFIAQALAPRMGGEPWTSPSVLLLSEHPTSQHHPTAHHMWLRLPYWAKAPLGAGLMLNQGITPPAWSLSLGS